MCFLFYLLMAIRSPSQKTRIDFIPKGQLRPDFPFCDERRQSFSQSLCINRNAKVQHMHWVLPETFEWTQRSMEYSSNCSNFWSKKKVNGLRNYKLHVFLSMSQRSFIKQRKTIKRPTTSWQDNVGRYEITVFLMTCLLRRGPLTILCVWYFSARR